MKNVIRCSYLCIAFIFLCCDDRVDQQQPRERRTYFPNGSIESIEQLDKDGKRAGEAKYYFATGSLYMIAHYSNDSLNGEMKIFYPSGKIQQISNYVNGKGEGISTGYYESGVISGQGVYTNGEKNKTFINYYENGNKKSEYVYDHGKRFAYTVYDEQGNITEKSISIHVAVPDKKVFVSGNTVPVNISLKNTGYYEDSLIALIRINNGSDSIVDRLNLNGDTCIYKYTPKVSGSYTIKAHVIKYANTKSGAIFHSEDSVQIYVQKK